MKFPRIKISAQYRFAIRAVSLIILWKALYWGFILPFTSLNPWLTNKVGASAAGVFNWLGASSSFDGLYLYVSNTKSVLIGDPCNGLELFVLFIGFIVITPGKWIHKIVYGFLGLSILFFVNVVRVYLLGFNYLKSPATFEFNHKYTYLLFVYAIIGVLWFLWIEVINKKHFAKNS